MNDCDQRRYDRLICGQTSSCENGAAIGEILDRAAEDVRHLDAIMYNKYARQPEKLSAWQSDSRVEPAPQRDKNDGSGSVDNPA